MLHYREDKKMRDYTFEVYNDDLLACWNCKDDSWDNAVNRWIEVLKDPAIREDDFDSALYDAIIKKLTESEFLIDTDNYILYMTFTDEELEQL